MHNQYCTLHTFSAPYISKYVLLSKIYGSGQRNDNRYHGNNDRGQYRGSDDYGGAPYDENQNKVDIHYNDYISDYIIISQRGGDWNYGPKPNRYEGYGSRGAPPGRSNGGGNYRDQQPRDRRPRDEELIHFNLLKIDFRPIYG